jgi:hypothetical protein
MDLYPTGRSTPLLSFPDSVEVDRNYPLDVAFLPKGNHVISGAHKGCVNIWNTCTGEHWQSLEHNGELGL